MDGEQQVTVTMTAGQRDALLKAAFVGLKSMTIEDSPTLVFTALLALDRAELTQQKATKTDARD